MTLSADTAGLGSPRSLSSPAAGLGSPRSLFLHGRGLRFCSAGAALCSLARGLGGAQSSGESRTESWCVHCSPLGQGPRQPRSCVKPAFQATGISPCASHRKVPGFRSALGVQELDFPPLDSAAWSQLTELGAWPLESGVFRTLEMKRDSEPTPCHPATLPRLP